MGTDSSPPYTGLVTSSTAPGNVTTATTYDALGRPTLVSEANGTRTTTMAYADAERRKVVRQGRETAGDQGLIRVEQYDPVRAGAADPAAGKR